MENTIEPLHLAVAFDQNYITPFYVLITSIFQNSQGRPYHIHTIATGISDREKDDITSFVRQQQSVISFYELDSASVAGLVLPKDKYFTAAVYYRLLLPALVPATVEKLLYLDTDIVVIGNLAELYQTDISGYSLGAVAEVNATRNRPDLGIYEVGTYFNSGVMLINVAEWRQQQVSEKATRFLRDYPEKIVWADQDALNVVLMNNYVKLPGRFNVIPFDIPRLLPKNKYAAFLKDKVVIHYTLKEHKPWDMQSINPFRYLYYKYLKQSPRAYEKKYRNSRPTAKAIKTFVQVRMKEQLLTIPGVLQIISLLFSIDIGDKL